MTTFFTSDNHFGHGALIRHGYRTFFFIEEMDEIMITRWNEVVCSGDTVWHLGDFTMKKAEIADRALRRLRGNVHLVWGNHDRNNVRVLPRWRSSQYATEIKLDGHRITLYHYTIHI